MKPNKLYPGRPNYTGPKSGYFAFIHHEVLFEKSNDIMERVAFIKSKKPKNEITTRLHHLLYVETKKCKAISKRAPLYADYKAKRAQLYADYKAKRAQLYADYEAKCAPLYADYKAKRAQLYADYEAKRAPLYADYEAKCLPLYADYEAKCLPLYADYEAKRAPLYADYKAKRAQLYAEILKYIKQHVHPFKWDGKTLIFTK